jgi:hypothetical protein
VVPIWSINLHAMQVRDMGLWLTALGLSPLMNTGATLACLK